MNITTKFVSIRKHHIKIVMKELTNLRKKT